MFTGMDLHVYAHTHTCTRTHTESQTHTPGALAAWLLYCLGNDDTIPPDVCRDMLPPEEACLLNWVLEILPLNPRVSPT